MFVSVVDWFLERCSASAYYHLLAYHFLEGVNRSYSAVELYDIDRLESISECAVDYALEITQALCGDGTRYVNGDEQLSIELTYAAHILESCPAVRFHPRQLLL